MANDDVTYTYRAGKKVVLRKRADQFVVRELPENLDALGFASAERVSSASSRVDVAPQALDQEMERARRTAPTHHAYEREDSNREFLITDRVLVTFRSAPSQKELADFMARYALVKVADYSEREFLFRLTDQTGMNPVKLVVQLTENEPAVELADHDLNQRMSKYQFSVPSDPSYPNQWHLHRRSTSSEFDARSSSRCEDAWRLLDGFGSPDVVVGVTDDGCRLDHQDFDSNKFAGWGYFAGTRLVRSTDIDADPNRMYEAGANHGTSCAGVIAGEADAVLTVGAAPACRLLPIKWESQGPFLLISDSKLRTALDHVADKVDVLSNSWGSSPDGSWSAVVVNRVRDLAASGGRRGRGIVFLWAAGNENCPIEHSSNVDIPYTDGWNDTGTAWIGVQTSRAFSHNLVGIPGVMHIAALASTAQRSHYSNYGTGIAVCAPSSNSHEYWRLDLPGLGITTTSGSAVDARTASFGGTSSATPLVAGVAALVISANPQLTALEVVSILKRTAAKDLDTTAWPPTPPASYDPNPEWDVSPVAPFENGAFQNVAHPDGTWSPWFGHGRVDAEAAVAEALQSQPGDSAGGARHFETVPNKKIPDNDPTGVTSVIDVDLAGNVSSIAVQIEIRHTWIGDLRVDLIAPDQTTVRLHDRSGADKDDLVATFDLASLPALATLKGRPAQGKWTLRVQDAARLDEGTLVKWGIDLGAGAAPTVAEETPSVRIPDNDAAGIVRKLQLPAGAPIADVTVSVDITHPWIGDLQVLLTPPGGSAIALHDRTGGGADNLIRSWRSVDLPALQALRGSNPGGTWELRVADKARRDEGKLNRWRIEVAA
jgi:subtilisin-like proprotein convertase family protein